MIEYLLFVYGLVYLLTKAQITEFIRFNIKNKFLQNLINCEMCSGFWLSIISTFIFKISIWTGPIIAVGFIYLINKLKNI